MKALTRQVGNIRVITEILPDISQQNNPLDIHPFGGEIIFFRHQPLQKISQLHRRYSDNPHAFLIEMQEVTMPFAEPCKQYKFSIAGFDPLRNVTKTLIGYWLASERIIQLCESKRLAFGQAAAAEHMEECCLEALSLYEAWVNKRIFQISSTAMDQDGRVVDSYQVSGFSDEDDALAIAEEIHIDFIENLKTA